MNIGEMLINKKVIEEAKELQTKTIETLDKQLLDLHYSIIGKQPKFVAGVKDGELEKYYIELSNLRKLLSVPTENFINANIDEILNQIPNKLTNFKIEISRLLNTKGWINNAIE